MTRRQYAAARVDSAARWRTTPRLTATVCWVLAFSGCTASLPVVQDVRDAARAADVAGYEELLHTMRPLERAHAIVLWWELHGAEFRPYPHCKTIRFREEIMGCGKSAVPVLESAMSSPNSEVRLGASAALSYLVPVSLPALEQLLLGVKDADWHVRKNCTMAVSKFGHLAKPAIPAMIANLEHDSGLLRGWTVCALALQRRFSGRTTTLRDVEGVVRAIGALIPSPHSQERGMW